MQNSMKSCFRLTVSSLASIGLCLGVAALSHAAPGATGHGGAKKSASVSSAPTSLGNGIFVIGDEASPSVPSAKTAPVRAVGRLAAAKAVRPLPTNLNAALVHFCRSYLGRQLGNGQCSELAMIGLPAIGARMDLSNQWGIPVCNYGAAGGRRTLQVGGAGSVRGNSRRVNIKAGDLIQYENVKFERNWNGGYSVREYPHHTSVIEQVSRDGNTIKVLEQNVNGTQFIVETVLYLPDQTEGIMRITRPVAR